ncbi:HvfC/BufC family peptide modification chaperone [Paraburkholderia adhaesiva]|uniref:HvfC/BufC family peptide modification chaperone n=1 Tax=Paraburkholderia adhaesiva TaxID=2883244 RepID=UPI001F2DD8A8|nr:putative DNA-binding domain-containing protein [Paraburkholderia adhaesiva]
MTRHDNDTLASLQEAFAAALADPDADASLAGRLQAVRASDSSQADALLRERIGLYRGNVRAARRQALVHAYPVLAELTGETYFDALALAYARAYPTRDADLNRFGASLPSFIEGYERDPRYAYFGDVARLEWALHVAAYAANVVPLTPQAWTDLGAERLATARLAVHPACAALASCYAVEAIWRAHRPGAEWPGCIDTPSWTLVLRPQWRPALVTHTEAAHVAFVALQRGDTLGEALDEAFTVDAGFDFARLWRVWINSGAITGLRDG